MNPNKRANYLYYISYIQANSSNSYQLRVAQEAKDYYNDHLETVPVEYYRKLRQIVAVLKLEF